MSCFTTSDNALQSKIFIYWNFISYFRFYLFKCIYFYLGFYHFIDTKHDDTLDSLKQFIFLSTFIYLFIYSLYVLSASHGFPSYYCNVHSMLRQLLEKWEKKKKKEAPVSLYIVASQTAWRYPSTSSWACEELRELRQDAAVNKDWF